MRTVILLSAIAFATPAAFADDIPRFEVDPSWPRTLPNNWIMGQAAGVAVDAQDHVWVIQRPKSLTNDEKAATLDPPTSKCCAPAPPVMEFDQDGKLVQAWGGPGPGYDWPQNEHGVSIDHKGFVWIGGNGEKDGQYLKFTREGKFVLEIGKQGDQNQQQRLRSPGQAGRRRGRSRDQRALHRRRIFRSSRDRVRRRQRRLQAPLGGVRQQADGRKARFLQSDLTAIQQPGSLRQDREGWPRLHLRPRQQPHPGVPQGRQLREGVRLREEHQGLGFGLGPRLLDRRQ